MSLNQENQNRNIFAYGSLSRGMVHYQKLQSYVVDEQPATVQGSIYRLPVGFPAFVAGGQTRVSGTVLTVSGPEVLFSILDEMHGFAPLSPERSLYWRTEVAAQLESGEFTDVMIYGLNPAKLPRAAVRIDDGDWSEVMKKSPSVVEQLSDRQVQYVRRLGGSNGREIVPIDMDIYRDLMKLEIIVDKGRRLALTNLGKEVYRFLG